MPVPATPILDTFDRANESPLTLGGAWTTAGTGSGTHRALRVISNACNGTNANVLNASFRTGPFGPDCEAYITYTTLSATAATYIRLGVRGSGFSGDLWNAYVMQWSNDANGCRLFVDVAGTLTLLEQDAGAVPVAGDQITLRAEGNLIAIYRNGTPVISTMDTTYTQGGDLLLGYRTTDGALNDFGGGLLPEGDLVLTQQHVMGHNVW